MKAKIRSFLNKKRGWLFPLTLVLSAAAVILLLFLFGKKPPEGSALSFSEAETETAANPEAVSETEQRTNTEPATEEDIEYLSHAAYMNGNASFFLPDRLLTRAEAAVLTYRLFGGSEGDAVRISDIPENSAVYSEIAGVVGYFPALEQNRFQPDEPILREDLFYVIFHACQNWSTYTDESAHAGETPYTAFALQLGLMNGDETSEYVTRGEAAHIFNRVTGRTPDEDLLPETAPVIFADVSPACRYYTDILEAAVPHEYYEADEREVWGDTEFAQLKSGFYRRDGIAYYVQADGTLLTAPGLQEIPAGTVFVADESGRIWADNRPHLSPDGVVFCRSSGTILKHGSRNGYTFDENGIYTSGYGELDEWVNGIYSECLTDKMTQEEKLRACFDYILEFNYLGRNLPLDTTVKTMSVDVAKDYALKFFETGKGDCYNFTAAFLFLARGLGYDAEAVVGYCSYVWSANAIAHGWVEITLDDGNVRICDAQLENFNIRAGISNEDYGAFMTTYEQSYATYYPN